MKRNVVAGFIVVSVMAALWGLVASLLQSRCTAGYIGHLRVDHAEVSMFSLGLEEPEVWQALVFLKAEQALFAENDICPPFDYQDFLKQLQQENEARHKAIARGEIIYGPKEYKAQDYYRYLHSNYRMALQKLWEHELESEVDESQLRKAYLSLRDERFVRREAGILELLETIEGPVIQTIEVESAVPKMQTAAQKAYRSLLETTSQGEVVELELEGVSQLVRCAFKEPKGYLSFDEVRSSLQREALEAQYQSRISAKAAILVLDTPK